MVKGSRVALQGTKDIPTHTHTHTHTHMQQFTAMKREDLGYDGSRVYRTRLTD